MALIVAANFNKIAGAPNSTVVVLQRNVFNTDFEVCTGTSSLSPVTLSFSQNDLGSFLSNPLWAGGGSIRPATGFLYPRGYG